MSFKYADAHLYKCSHMTGIRIVYLSIEQTLCCWLGRQLQDHI